MEFLIKNKLRELRKENHLTQKQMAKILNKSETGYASWEQGLAEPSINEIRFLCIYFHISADDFLMLDEENEKKTSGTKHLQ